MKHRKIKMYFTNVKVFILLIAFTSGIILIHSSACKDKIAAPDEELTDTDEEEEIIFSGIFTTRGTQLVSPQGDSVNLCGWRVQSRDWARPRYVSLADFTHYKSQGLLGNAQAVEIWWASENPAAPQPSENLVYQPGVYQKQNLPKLLSTLRAVARSGSWIIPSIRVSYDSDIAIENTRTGINTWEGWPLHRRVIYNDPVVIEEGPDAGTYGNHRDRFFDWLDYLIPAILADEEIASHIAYWEMWHYFGHRQREHLNTADYNHYLDDFIPRLLAKYREHDPDRLLGVGITLNSLVNLLNTRIENNTWTPYEDKNWIFVCGGYGRLGILNGNTIIPNASTWPVHSVNPEWLPATGEFNIEKLLRLSGRGIHSQEGPGLWNAFRETPIPGLQRTWLIGLYNLYNSKTNGYGFHAWPPSWADQFPEEKTAAFNETEFFNLTREALKGNPVE